MKIKLYKSKATIFSDNNISFYEGIHTETQQPYMLRVLDENISDQFIDQWYKLYDTYLLTITNFNYLPKVHSVDRSETNALYVVLDYYPGMSLQEKKHLTFEEVEQLFNAVLHLHKKGIVHGHIISANIWITAEGKVILYGAGEWAVIKPKVNYNQVDDIKQILKILEEFTDISPEKMGQLTRASLTGMEDLLDIWHTPIKSGLVEKEINIQDIPTPIPIIQQPEPILKHNHQQEPKPPMVRRKTTSFWLFVGGAITAGALTVGIWLGSSMQEKDVPASAVIQNESAKKQESIDQSRLVPSSSAPKLVPKEKPSIPVSTKLPSFTKNDATRIYPDWMLVNKQEIAFSEVTYILLAIAQDRGSDEFSGGLLKLVSVQYDTNKKKWQEVWESKEYETDYTPSRHESKDILSNFLITQQKNETKALVMFELPSSGSAGFTNIGAFTIDEQGKGVSVWSGIGQGEDSVSKKGNIFVTEGPDGEGRHMLSIENNKFVSKEIPRSEMAPSTAVKVYFKTADTGEVVATERSEVMLKKGQTISFVPSDTETKQLFDNGEISLYTDNGSGFLSTSNANRWSVGNAYIFERPGTYTFLLENYKEFPLTDNIVPTFTVTVKP